MQCFFENEFSEEIIYELSIIQSFISSALENWRRSQQFKLLSRLSKSVVKFTGNDHGSQEVCNSVVSNLVGPDTSFKACILRLLEQDQLIVKARERSGTVTWNSRKDQARKLGEAIAGGVAKSGQRELREDIDQNIDEFKNKDWIKNKPA